MACERWLGVIERSSACHTQARGGDGATTASVSPFEIVEEILHPTQPSHSGSAFGTAWETTSGRLPELRRKDPGS